MAYTAIEYIESTGTQYIDTGYYASDKTKVEMHFRNDIPEDNSYFFGGRNAWNNKDYGTLYEEVYGFAYTDVVWSDISNIEDVLMITEVPKITVNGTTYTGNTVDDYVCEYPMFIFGMNNAGTAYKRASISLYYMKIWDDGTLLFDLIPVLDENNVACLYNKVTGTYLYNAGTEDFIAGSVIASPIITIGTPSRTKISSVSGYDQATVTFQSDMALAEWEARATTEGQETGHGVGLLVESGSTLAENTDATVYVDDEELTSGDLEYTISIFGHGTNGYWSDGTYEEVNLFNIMTSIGESWCASVEGTTITIDTSEYNNTSTSEMAISGSIWDYEWGNEIPKVWTHEEEHISFDFVKTETTNWFIPCLEGDVYDGAITIILDGLENGKTYNVSFTISTLSLNYAVFQNFKIVEVV